MKYNSKSFLALLLSISMTTSPIANLAVSAQEPGSETGTEAFSEQETMQETGTESEKATEKAETDEESEKATEKTGTEGESEKVTEKTGTEGESEKTTEKAETEGESEKATEETGTEGESEKTTDTAENESKPVTETEPDTDKEPQSEHTQETMPEETVPEVNGETESGTTELQTALQQSVNAESEQQESESQEESEKEEDGEHSVTVNTDNKMFKVVNAVVAKKNGKMTALVTLSGTGYDYLYVGSAADAPAHEAQWIKMKDTVSYQAGGETKTGARFEIPVSALDTPVCIAAHSKKNDTWADRTMTFQAASMVEAGEALEDGDYQAGVDLDFAENKMFKVVNAVLTKKDGKMTAKITLSGIGYDYLYIGSAADAPEHEAQWIGTSGTVSYKDESGAEKEGYCFEIPVEKLGTPIALASHAVKSNKWADRKLAFSSFSLEKEESGTDTPETNTPETNVPETNAPETNAPETSAPENGGAEIVIPSGIPDAATAAVDQTTTLPDGVYTPEAFSFAGGSGKTKIFCKRILVKDQKTYAEIQFSSASYDLVWAGGYQWSKTNTTGNSTFIVPVQLNAENTIIGNTTAMSTAKQITYTIRPELSQNAQTEPETESEQQTESETTTEKETEKEKETETEAGTPVNPSKLSNGTYRVNVTSSAAMFRVVNCVLTYKDGSMTAEITLSGTGYDKLFMGTAAQAGSASADQQIGYTPDAEGKYVYRIPVSALDTPIAVAAHSHKNDTWYDRELTFSSAGMVKFDSEDDPKQTEKETEKSDTKPNKKPDKKPETVSKYETDLSGGTSKVDSSTGLKDGVYAPDRFSWSGGSGRTSISCSKVTVTGGQAYATIVFGSSNYSYVKANGNKYFPVYGSGTSSFTIPVKLNANNTIIGMTTAMSAAHEITYSIYVYIAGADDKASGTQTKVDKNQLSSEAPEVIGLEQKDAAKIEQAEYFKIYYYDQDVTMIEIDLASDTDKPDKEDETEAADAENLEAAEEAEAAEEMDAEQTEAVNAEAASEEEADVQDELTMTSELYHDNVVRYLIVPEDVEIPIALKEDMIIIQSPVESVYTDAEMAASQLEELECLELLTVENEEAGTKPDYRELIMKQCDLAILDAAILWDEEKDMSLEEQSDFFYEVTERLTTLGIPVFIDRSADEKSEEAAAEWSKVYEEIFR